MLSLPYTNRTRQIINAERLRKLESSAFIVNVSRGELIDQEALIETLKENRIAGAALDVATPEPLPFDKKRNKGINQKYYCNSDGDR